MRKREPVVHGFTEKPRRRRSSPMRSRSMMSKVRPNLLSSSSFHCTSMAGGGEITIKSMRRRSRSSRIDEPGLDGLAEADVVGDQQIDARQPQGLAQGKELIGVEPDAGAERRLQQIAVGGGGGAPADRAQIGGEHLGAVGPAASDLRPGVVLDDARTDLGVPQHLDLLALRVVGDAGETQRGEIGLAVVDRLDQPRPAAHFDELALLNPHPSLVLPIILPRKSFHMRPAGQSTATSPPRNFVAVGAVPS